MKWLGIALIYLGFFAVIGFAAWVSASAWPLLALVFMPSVKGGDGEDENSPPAHRMDKPRQGGKHGRASSDDVAGADAPGHGFRTL